MDAETYFGQERDKHLAEAQKIVDEAEADSRGLNDGERAMVAEHTKAAEAFQDKIDSARENAELKERLERMGAAMATEPEQVVSAGETAGDMFVQYQGYRDLVASHFASSGGRWTTGTIELFGAAGDPVLKSTGSNDDVIPDQFVPGLKTPSLNQETPSLASLFAQGVATGGTIKYIKVTTRNAPANAVTAEGQDKPGAEFAFDDATATLEKLAAFIPISEEMVEDSPAVRDYINAQLPFMIVQAEDKKLASEVYTAASGSGLSADIGGTDANGFDAIAAAINDVQVNGKVDPDGLFIHPTDWWSMAVKKTGGDEHYYSGGPYSGPARNPWGLRTVISQRAPLGFPLVGNFRQGGQVWRRGGVRLEMSNSHDDYFVKNLIAVRAEERVALTVYYPEFFSIANLAS